MPVVDVEELVRLQRNAEDVRNICILAHVDHGKTSFSDSLIATNGIISPKLAGKIRYLDARPDEQVRGITMESSAISLYFPMLRRPTPDAAPVKKEHLINLIDSPGHIDFSSEVSTASRLCDGAVVLVDAVEGVCSQTVTVLRHTWVEKLRPILVINKIDRLISELKMSSLEAFHHMSRLIEQVNAVIGSFFQGERMEEDLLWREHMEERLNAAAKQRDGQSKQTTTTTDSSEGISENTEWEERDDQDLYFSPERNNVIFCSAIDGWAFTIRQFAVIYEKKLGFKRSLLEKVLWGDYYLDPKTKRVLGQKHLKGRNLKPMFVQLVLDSIWAVYNATTGGDNGRGDPEMLQKIIKSLSVSIPPHVLRSRDPKNMLTSVLTAWLPLSTAVLISIIEYLPAPPAAQTVRLPPMISNSPGAESVSAKIHQAMATFNPAPDVPIVAYVSKMVAIPESELPATTKKTGIAMTGEEARELARRKREEIAKLQAESRPDAEDAFSRVTDTIGSSSFSIYANEEPLKQDPEHLIGFARLYSGTLSVGDEIYVLPPKFTPTNPHADPEPKKVTVKSLYLLMGRAMENLQSVPAGMVFGIGGLEGHILKTGTLCSQLEGGVNLAGVNLAGPPIVRVALEPDNPMDLDKMTNGLKLLERSDPCAQYEVMPSGEHVIITAGELHLERCLKDLKERYAKCEIQVGSPIVPYRESIVSAPEMPAPKNPELPRGTVIATTLSKQLTIRIRVRPLPSPVADFLSRNTATIKKLHSSKGRKEHEPTAAEAAEGIIGNVHAGGSQETNILSGESFKRELQHVLESVEEDNNVWREAMNQTIEFGPKRMGPNILLDATADGSGDRFFEDPGHASRKRSRSLELCSDKISYAFQLATTQGPLCHEPVQGIAVFLEEVTVAENAEDESGRLIGEIIRCGREAIYQGFHDWSPRILLAMYSCEIQASSEVLGRVYAVLTRRRGRILSEAMKEGTPFFTILSLLPVAESFGFSDEIRKRTSGAASPQLIFAGFEMLDEDPFWVPATEEELEDLGQLADRENVAKKYMDSVRERKGLIVAGKKLVKDAEKQKTLKK